MLKIRLQRVGRTHEPSFRLVLTDSKNATKSGKYVESLGSFDARRGEKAEFKADRIKELIGKGAQPTDTVHNQKKKKKIIEGKKINVLPLKKAIVKDVPAEAVSAPVVETPAPAQAEPVVEATPEVAPEAPAPAPAEVPSAENPTPEATA